MTSTLPKPRERSQTLLEQVATTPARETPLAWRPALNGAAEIEDGTFPNASKMITRFSELGTPTEPLRWWAPLGWLLVLVSSVIMYGVFLALSPLIVLYIVGLRLRARRLRYHRNPEELRIAIIGAGWSGLQCLERFKKLGVTQVDVFERYDDIGGTWHKNLRYPGLQIHGSMTVTSFDCFPYSDDPDVQRGKVMAEEVESYIRRFSDANDLRSHCQFHSNVDSVSYDSGDGTGTVSYTDTLTGEEWESGPYDMVIWASMAAYGNIPRLDGSESFRGKQLHTTQFRSADFKDIVKNNKKLVVVGGGKAACDVVLGFWRAGYRNFTWTMRKPYLFYKFEVLLHNASLKDKIRGFSYLATVLWCGVSMRLGAVLHWASGHLFTYGKAHADFRHFHGGLLCATQRQDLQEVPYTVGNPVRLAQDRVIFEDGREVECDVVIWATGNRSGIDKLKLTRDGKPFTLDPKAKLYNHFIVPQMPVLASSTALWTSFGPMRATNSADLAVYHLCVRKERTPRQMEKSARRQISDNSIIHSFIWAANECWLQQWVYFHIDLVLQGLTPVESFLKHALEVFVFAKETPLEFKILPRPAAR